MTKLYYSHGEKYNIVALSKDHSLMGEQKGVEVQRWSTGWRGWEVARQGDRQTGW